MSTSNSKDMLWKGKPIKEIPTEQLKVIHGDILESIKKMRLPNYKALLLPYAESVVEELTNRALKNE